MGFLDKFVKTAPIYTDNKALNAANAVAIPTASFQPEYTPSYLERFMMSDGGGLVDTQPSGYNGGALNVFMYYDYYQYNSRIGKYPVPTANQQQPANWECGLPTNLPAMVGGGCVAMPLRTQLQTPANGVNPLPEFMGDTVYDAYMAGESPLIAQQLTQAPLQNPTTLAALGWQDAEKIIMGNGTPTGRYEPKP